MCMKHAPLLNLMKTKASLLRVARVGTRSIKSVNDANRKTTNQSFRKKFTLKILLSSEKAEKSPPPNNWSNAELKKAHSNNSYIVPRVPDSTTRAPHTHTPPRP